jgi:hypothetical protein
MQPNTGCEYLSVTSDVDCARQPCIDGGHNTGGLVGSGQVTLGFTKPESDVELRLLTGRSANYPMPFVVSAVRYSTRLSHEIIYIVVTVRSTNLPF